MADLLLRCNIGLIQIHFYNETWTSWWNIKHMVINQYGFIKWLKYTYKVYKSIKERQEDERLD